MYNKTAMLSIGHIKFNSPLEPLRLQKILKIIVENTDRPVTVKIRSGWDGTSVNASETALRAQDAGVKALIIHGRTRLQAYTVHEITQTMKKHLDLNISFHGEERGVMRFRKFFGWYTRGMSVKMLKMRAFHAVTREDNSI